MDILTLLTAWAAGAAVVGGWGLGTCRALGLIGLDRSEPLPVRAEVLPPVGRGGTRRADPPTRRPGGVGVAGWWAGLASLLLFLQGWHLVLPVDRLAWLPVLAVALLGGWVGRGALARWVRFSAARPALPGAVAVAAVLLAVRVAAGEDPTREVTAAWAPLVQLGRQWALPVGIANLSAPLGLNHAWTLVASLLSVGPWAGLPGRAASGLVALPLAAAALAGLGHALVAARSRGAEAGPDARVGLVAAFYDAGGALLVAAWVAGPGLAAPRPGVAAGALFFVSLGQAWRGASAGLVSHRGERIDRLSLSLLLAVAAAAADPATAVLAGPLVLWAGWCLLATERAWLPARRSTRSVGVDHDLLPGAAPRRRTVLVAAGAVVAVAGLWLLRSVWATGHPAFPYDDFPLPLGWTLNGKAVRSVARALSAGAPLERLPAQVVPVLLPAVLGGAVWLLWLVSGGIEGRHRRLAPLPLVVGAGLSCSFFLPGPTLATAGNAAAACGLAASGLALLALGAGSRGRAAERHRPGLHAAGVLAVCGGLLAAAPLAERLTPAGAAPPVAAAGPAGLQPWESAWGAGVAIPAGDRGGAFERGLPGYATLPSAGKKPPDALRERVAGEPRRGYVIDRRDPRSVVW